ncbi:MAG: hypothetical protein N2554_05105, partial [Fimbriimonadales bacterium]|nr:hypothetical protein [Fimbriimonadales bacterium]
FNWRETTRLALRSVTMLAVLSAASLTQLSANPFSVTIRSGQGVTYTLAPNCSGNFSNAPFTPAHFNAAASGSAASVVSPFFLWIPSLPADPQAQWISTNPNGEGHTALFAQRFILPCIPADGTVTLTFHWAADDQLGDPPNGAPNMGVFINGIPLNIHGGTFSTQSTVTVPVPASILNAGANYLYVYVWEYGCVSPGGVIYSATIRGLCSTCIVENEQPWNRCLPSTPSAVVDCAPPLPYNMLGAQCADDFIATYTGSVNTVEWWGTLSDPAQRHRPFQISIFPRNQPCQRPEGMPIYSVCVRPQATPVGWDCRGKRVWHFRAHLPAPYFQQVAGQAYWLMILEVDSESVRPYQNDFEWSGHAACKDCPNGELVCNCRAIKITLQNNQIQVNPVLGCHGEITDLAWALRWRTRIVVNTHSPLRSAITARLRIPGGAVVEERALQVEEYADESGTVRYRAVLDTPLPEGDYELEVVSNGALALRQQVNLDGGVLEVDGNGMLWGDLNGDGSIDDADLLTVLFNFGARE